MSEQRRRKPRLPRPVPQETLVDESGDPADAVYVYYDGPVPAEVEAPYFVAKAGRLLRRRLMVPVSRDGLAEQSVRGVLVRVYANCTEPAR